jgi:hypothetical protein
VTREPIRGVAVRPLVPSEGTVHVLLIGEAPGPRGADKSGVPFFGDAAGKHLYAALAGIGAVSLPAAVQTLPWDGAQFAAHALRPMAHGVALGNAFDRCPTDDGASFRAPSRSELEGPLNVARLQQDIVTLQARGLCGVVTLGRVATRIIGLVCDAGGDAFRALRLRAVPHPSAQGLLSMAPNRGRGARMHDLQVAWMQRCIEAVYDAGYPRMALGDSV